MADFFLRTPTLTASNFATLWATDPKFLALKDLNPFSKCGKIQAADNILRVGFVWSKWPHFHRVYLVTVCKRSSIAVFLSPSQDPILVDVMRPGRYLKVTPRPNSYNANCKDNPNNTSALFAIASCIAWPFWFAATTLIMIRPIKGLT